MVKPTTLGSELQRFRMAAGFTLRRFAEKLEISAAHQSDIEHDRRRPSRPLLERMVGQLHHVGADLDSLSRLDTRLEPDVQEWVTDNPAARQMLRAVRNSGQNPNEILRKLEELLKQEAQKK
jgi:transcriptional regulator with XRE-family HTH domain